MDNDAPDTPPGESDISVTERLDRNETSQPASGEGILPRRSSTDRYLGGVASGIADRFGIDAFVPRAGFLGLTLFTVYAADWIPAVPIFYAVLWLTFPDSTGSSILRTLRQPSSVREAAAAVAWCAALALMLSRPVFAVALALAAAAWVLLRDDQFATGVRQPMDQLAREPRRQLRTLNLRKVTPDDAATDGAAADAKESNTGNGEKGLSWGRRRRSERGEKLVGHFSRVAARPRREPALWPLTFGLIAFIVIAMAMADRLVDGGVDPSTGVNAALIGVGAVVLLSAWRGRAMWTALIVIALLPAWIGFSVADVGRFEGAGSVSHRPTVLPALGALDYENGYGSTTIDLRDLALDEGANLSVRLGVTAGSAKIYAPLDTNVVLRSKVGFGTTEVRGNGLDFFEYDREPFMDRYMVRQYDARGRGCISDYWATWEYVADRHQAAGVDLGTMSTADQDDVEPILAAIAAAGYRAPTPVDHPPVNGYTDLGFPRADSLDAFERTGDDPQAFQVAQLTWSFSADIDGQPCMEQPPPDNPATIEINATIGVGTLEVIRDEF